MLLRIPVSEWFKLLATPSIDFAEEPGWHATSFIVNQTIRAGTLPGREVSLKFPCWKRPQDSQRDTPVGYNSKESKHFSDRLGQGGRSTPLTAAGSKPAAQIPAMALPWHCHGNAIAVSWHFHSIAMATPWKCHRNATAVPWQ